KYLNNVKIMIEPDKENITKAKSLFEQGYNCCQSVFTAFATEKALDKNTCLKISADFAAGLGFYGKTCGAVVGAHMLIGLYHGHDKPTDEKKKAHIKELTQKYRKQFEANHGSTICNELLDGDVSTSDGINEIRKKDYFKTKCPNFVEDSARILNKLL
ncbi:MAG: hypothetical protein DRJ10_21415, partial [Bacteroidetes bacterium]